MTRLFFRLALAIILDCLACGSPVRAALGETGFSQGNVLYAAGNYSGAVDAYESQVRRGEYTANLFDNLADAYHRQGNRGRAILNYQRALILDPMHAEAASNLAFVRGVKSNPPASPSGWMVTALPWGAAVAGWLGLAGLIVAAWARRRRAVGFLLSGAGLLGCAAGVAVIRFAGPPTDTGRAVVVADSAPVFYAPADNSKVVTTLTAGGEVRVLSDQGAWSYTRLNDGTLAWIASDKIERLVPR